MDISPTLATTFFLQRTFLYIHVLQKHKKQIYVQRCIAEANIFSYKKLNSRNTSSSFLQTTLKDIMISSSVPEIYTSNREFLTGSSW